MTDADAVRSLNLLSLAHRQTARSLRALLDVAELNTSHENPAATLDDALDESSSDSQVETIQKKKYLCLCFGFFCL